MLLILMTAEYLEKIFWGEKDKGFELMNVWLEATRLTVAATSVSRQKEHLILRLTGQQIENNLEK